MDIPFTVKARPDTGLWNAKIAIWLFLASEVMLFGGLFSAYIFLRIGSDTPWPVHVLDIKMGFINTLILITSSITVLQAWLSLKMRNYSRYVVYMAVTLGLATLFMIIKLTEYGTKFHHYGVRLQDGSVLEGHLPQGYQIKFGDVKKIVLASRASDTGLMGLSVSNPGSDAGFLSYIEGGGTPAVTDEDHKDLTLDSGTVSKLVGENRKSAQKMIADRAKADHTIKKLDTTVDKDSNPDYTNAQAFLKDPKNQVKATVTLEAKQPIKFSVPPGKLASYDGTHAVFHDGTTIEGKLEDDSMRLLADRVDLRMLIPDSEKNVSKAFGYAEKSDAWRILGSEWQEAFVKHKAQFMSKHGGSKATFDDADLAREAFTMSLEVKEGGAGSTPPAPAAAKAGEKAEVAAPAAEEHKPAAAAGHHLEEPEVSIQKKDIAFYSNFTPKYHNYYAIYFALTSLHGLHIIGGAIVLGYFLLFGRKLYEQNPEHMANRVEVGGLFWHFVDVVWMVLFPVLYLM